MTDMKPSAEEIRFAQQRMKINDTLAPYLMKQAQAGDLQLQEGGGNLARPDGPPLPDTLKDQELSTFVRFTTENGNEYRVDLFIAHTDAWHPAVTVYTSLGGPTATTVIYDDINGGIDEVRAQIDPAFRRIRDDAKA
jgi:hypothetical protein